MSNTLKLHRTFHEGWTSFRRNGWLSVATVTIFTLALLVVGLTFVFGFATSMMLSNLEDKININVAFETDVPESRILEIKKDLERYSEVASVEYISRDQALAQFMQSSGDDPTIAKALDEIGDNPLPASLTIKARQPEQYDIIATAINQSAFKDDISRVNYEKNKKIITTVSDASQNTKQVGLSLAAIFIAVAMIMVLNTIRINIHSRRQEFEVMRLVGASNTYMRLPPVFEGMLYGATAAVCSIILLIPAINLVGSSTLFLLEPGFLLHYYFTHLFSIFLGLLFLGCALGATSGFLALNKYLKF